MYIALSPSFAVRNEKRASYLISVNRIIEENRDFSSFCIPPFIGYILSRIGEFEYTEALKAISASLNVTVTAIDNFVQQLVENPEKKEFRFSDKLSIVLPAGLLKKYTEKHDPIVFEEQGFSGRENYVEVRPTAPFSANLMVTTNCTTDCIYCYANRNLRPNIKTEKLLDLIKELHDQGTVNVTLTGGDIFAHPDWPEILLEMRKFGYKPFLSTKTPLTYDQINCLRGIGYDEIQFSLDSADQEVLRQLINVKDGYLNKVGSFLKDCSELKLDVQIRSVLTRLNASEDRILALYSFLSGFSCVKEWDMTPAFFSKYKERHYKSLEVNNDDLIWVYNFTRRPDLAFKIGLNKISDKGYVLKKFKTPEEYVCHNQICMANTTCISILANGDCSVCEMLYDTPEYLLGNVTESSLREIWNSERALQLYAMSRSLVPASSPCRACEVFEKCRNGYGKRVCYLDIAKSGHSKWEPDPRCPHADDIDMIL